MPSIGSIRRAHALGRVLWKVGSRHDAVRGGVAAAKTVGKATARATRILLLEVVGSFFAFFALGGAYETLGEWRKLQVGSSQGSASHVAVPLLFTLMFAWFCMTTFLRARRLSNPVPPRG
jgi:hypothetical protein